MSFVIGFVVLAITLNYFIALLNSYLVTWSTFVITFIIVEIFYICNILLNLGKWNDDISRSSLNGDGLERIINITNF